MAPPAPDLLSFETAYTGRGAISHAPVRLFDASEMLKRPTLRWGLRVDNTAGSGTPTKVPWYDPRKLGAIVSRRTDYTRVFVTGALVLTFIGVLWFGALASTSASANWSNVKEYLNVALPAITGLLGSAMGFYFGSAANHTFQLTASDPEGKGPQSTPPPK